VAFCGGVRVVSCAVRCLFVLCVCVRDLFLVDTTGDVVCCVVLFELCVCVCDLFLFLHHKGGGGWQASW